MHGFPLKNIFGGNWRTLKSNGYERIKNNWMRLFLCEKSWKRSLLKQRLEAFSMRGEDDSLPTTPAIEHINCTCRKGRRSHQRVRYAVRGKRKNTSQVAEYKWNKLEIEKWSEETSKRRNGKHRWKLVWTFIALLNKQINIFS